MNKTGECIISPLGHERMAASFSEPLNLVPNFIIFTVEFSLSRELKLDRNIIWPPQECNYYFVFAYKKIMYVVCNLGLT
jgi:hypothetical protein